MLLSLAQNDQGFQFAETLPPDQKRELARILQLAEEFASRPRARR
ncbi:hypothetical protein HMPREF0972_00710 [Actinomyces sp. oral taxon 848 str. F0332]|nr:hypothetical protein HMPREF0972_00710 [Actinomyces sp. oral taxon 848 str. F0332]